MERSGGRGVDGQEIANGDIEGREGILLRIGQETRCQAEESPYADAAGFLLQLAG